jgi:Spy/CpxP family protein refolding chaperone
MTKLIVILGFVIAFAAGLVMGVNMRTRDGVSAALPTTRPMDRGDRGGMLTKELNLTPQQQEQMKQIWSEVVRHGGHDQDDRRNQFRKERDDAISSLIKPEDRTKFDEIKTNYSEQMSSLEKDRRAAFDNAVKQTKEILTPEQRVKYEVFLKQHQPPFDRGGRDRDNRRGEDRATSRPASQP